MKFGSRELTGLFLDARTVCLQILDKQTLQMRLVNCAGKLLHVDDLIDTLNDHLVILLVLTLSGRRRLAYNVVRGRIKLYVKIDF